ncbi:MAG: oligoendopeptidase F [Spirochaetales bacterium]|nr:oligoendopeptidase F [Spirochaetales bacterium]
MKNTVTIPTRDAIPKDDTWDLSRLYPDDTSWDKDFSRIDIMVNDFLGFKGTLANNPQQLADACSALNEIYKILERLGNYAHLKTSEDEGNQVNQARMGKYYSLVTREEAAVSFFHPELMQIPDDIIHEWLSMDILNDFKIRIEKDLHMKPYTLSEKEEKIFALQIEAGAVSSKAFSALTNVDMDFGNIETPEGPRPLSQGTFSSFLISQNAELRKKAYHQFYSEFDAHKHTLSALLAGSIHKGVSQAKIRGFNSTRHMALFGKKVDESVYDNLIQAVHSRLKPLHRYYRLRKKIMGLPSLCHWDTYVPLVKDIEKKTSYDDAQELVLAALAPLGKEYISILDKGLRGRWVDKYENKGKRSGAFSAGSYFGDPYILLNYKEDDFRNVFTLAHEAGHSMHSYFCVQNNPFQHYDYTIFEAEVASTFNEELLLHHLISKTDDKAFQAYLLNREIDNIIATIFRQTMFAEFEYKTHTMAEKGEPLTLDSLRKVYRSLMETYFGGEVELDEKSDLECLRIPHFYRAFYVYQYATGLSAAIALSRRVLEGGDAQRNDYLRFLKTGGSKYPIESLTAGGVDMSSPAPVEAALDTFEEYVVRLEKAPG